MPKTPNYNFEVYDSSDTTTLFQNYRDSVTGSQTGSNTMLMDGILKQQQDEIDGLNSKPNIVQVQATGINSYLATVEGFAYAEGQVILLSVANTNTGDSTLNVNGLGVRPLLKNTASATLAQLDAGDLQQNNLYTFVNRGTNWVIADSDSLTLSGKNGAYYAQDIGKWTALGKGATNDANSIGDGVTLCNVNTPDNDYWYVWQSSYAEGNQKTQLATNYDNENQVATRRQSSAGWTEWSYLAKSSRPYFQGVRFTDYVVTPSDISYQTFEFNTGTYRGFGAPVPGTYAPIVQEAGLYLVEFSVLATSPTNGSVLNLLVSGGEKNVQLSNVAWTETSGQCFINVSTILALNVGDVIRFRYSGTAGRTYTLATSSRKAYLSAIKLDEL